MELSDLTPEEQDLLIAKAQATLTIDDLNPAVKQEIYRQAKDNIYRQIVTMQQAQITAFETFANLAVNAPMDTSVLDMNSDAITLGKQKTTKGKTNTKTKQQKDSKKSTTKNSKAPDEKPMFDEEFSNRFGDSI